VIAPVAAVTPLVAAAAPALVVGLAFDGKVAAPSGRSFSHEMHFNLSKPFGRRHFGHFQLGGNFIAQMSSTTSGVGSSDDLTVCRVATQH
jgi:hypothetical protein